MDDNYLIHYGILNMKWGIRRYQNPDGSLTEAGKKRYLKNYGKSNLKSKDDMLNDNVLGNIRKSVNISKLKNSAEKLDEVFKDYNFTKYSSIASITRSILDYGKNVDTGTVISGISSSVLDDGDQGYLDSRNVYLNDTNKINEYDNAFNKYKVSRSEYESELNNVINKKLLNDIKDEKYIRIGKDIAYELADKTEYDLNVYYDTVDSYKMNKNERSIMETAKTLSNKLGLSNMNEKDALKLFNLPGAVEDLGLSDKPLSKLTDNDINKIKESVMSHSSKDYEELFHSRTLGSKNNIRRYQNKDGTYTELGKERRRAAYAAYKAGDYKSYNEYIKERNEAIKNMKRDYSFDAALDTWINEFYNKTLDTLIKETTGIASKNASDFILEYSGVKPRKQAEIEKEKILNKIYAKHSDEIDDFICHYGVKGQSWGNRQYQYPDGSLTPEGRIHYGVGDPRVSSVTINNYSNERRELSEEEKYIRREKIKKGLKTAVVAGAIGAMLFKKYRDKNESNIRYGKEVLESKKEKLKKIKTKDLNKIDGQKLFGEELAKSREKNIKKVASTLYETSDTHKDLTKFRIGGFPTVKDFMNKRKTQKAAKIYGAKTKYDDAAFNSLINAANANILAQINR